MNQKNLKFSLKSITEYTNASPIRIIKILIGTLLTYLALRAYYYDFVTHAYLTPLFHYPLFPKLNWIINPTTIPYFFLGSLIFSSAMILEKKFPWSFIGYLICYIPIVSLDQTYYQDYQLAIIIICALLALTNTSNSKGIALKWEILSIRSLFSIILIWRGISYLYKDWLNGNVWTHIISSKFYYSPYLINVLESPILKTSIIILLPLFEITSAILPWKYPKYLIITTLYFIFYTNFYSYGTSLFDLNPIMIILGILSIAFIPNSTVTTVKNFITKYDYDQTQKSETPLSSKNKILKPLLLTFVIIQVLIPLNMYIFKDQIWYNSYPNFAWTMKQSTRIYSGHFIVVDPVTHKVIDRVIPKDQIKNSNSFITIAKKINKEFQDIYHFSPKIYGNFYIEINNRPRVPYTNPAIDLTKVDSKFEKHPHWILPPPAGYFD